MNACAQQKNNVQWNQLHENRLKEVFVLGELVGAAKGKFLIKCILKPILFESSSYKVSSDEWKVGRTGSNLFQKQSKIQLKICKKNSRGMFQS